jgi:hypothetical protein
MSGRPRRNHSPALRWSLLVGSHYARPCSSRVGAAGVGAGRGATSSSLERRDQGTNRCGIFMPAAVASEVARGHGLSPQHPSAWRKMAGAPCRGCRPRRRRLLTILAQERSEATPIGVRTPRRFRLPAPETPSVDHPAVSRPSGACRRGDSPSALRMVDVAPMVEVRKIQ